MFKYSKYYSGQLPEFIEGDIFRIIVPLDDSYSYNFVTGERKNADKMQISADKVPINIKIKDLSEQEKLIIDYLQKNDHNVSNKFQLYIPMKG